MTLNEKVTMKDLLIVYFDATKAFRKDHNQTDLR